MGNFILVDDAFAARAMWGILLAAAIAFGARRSRALTTGGAVTAAAVGAIAIAAGWSWAVLLLAFFVSSTVLSRWRREEKEARTGGVVAKDDERDAVQVLANGAIFAAAALFFKARWLLARDVIDQDPTWTISWMVLGAGALSAACADTWSTEIGTLAPGAPRLITTRREVPPGTSGGITGAGLAAGACGALFMALVVRIVHWPWSIALAAGVGGIAGTLADSLLGATLQGRRRCPKCGVATERDVHDCGTETEEAGGFAWLDNDAVNALGTGVGALAALGMWRLFT
jgi:uncharacterized protein (TIGR00297 family)